eukprot:TRINITY_DN11737_c0_g1_i1.p1 TRINITY_DN11737_c0_g1~~TRINITY_DN11737_c0_g1_i1.p1  ORF type:complete len:483 (+),score=71.82 TRINITY_DN11737_c0_g1_i1:1066-2514(+)
MLHRLLQSSKYHVFRTLLLVTDAALVLWETSRASAEILDPAIDSSTSVDSGVFVLTSILFFFFFLDAFGRFYAGYHRHYPGWSAFNVLVILIYIFDLFVYQMQDTNKYDGHWRWIGFFVKLRLFRMWQIVQVTPFTRKFQMVEDMILMLRSLRLTLKTTVSCFLMLSSFLVIIGVLLVDGTVRYCIHPSTLLDCSDSGLKEAFGSISAAVLTLFKAISGGDDWSSFYALLEPLPTIYPLIFLLFMFYSVFAFISVIVGTMVEGILDAAKSDKEMLVKSEKMNKREFIGNMSKIFKDVDKHGAGEIQLSDLQKHMEDVDVCAYFAALGVDSDQVSHLFALLDDDNSGVVTREEFLGGVLRLRGQAKSLDIAVVLQKLDYLADQIEVMEKVIRFAALSSSAPTPRNSRNRASSSPCFPRPPMSPAPAFPDRAEDDVAALTGPAPCLPKPPMVPAVAFTEKAEQFGSAVSAEAATTPFSVLPGCA